MSFLVARGDLLTNEAMRKQNIELYQYNNPILDAREINGRLSEADAMNNFHTLRPVYKKRYFLSVIECIEFLP